MPRHNNMTRAREPIVNLMLIGGRVTAGYREALFSTANRAGVSVNEYVLTAAAEKLLEAGAEFPGIYTAGDIPRQFS